MMRNHITSTEAMECVRTLLQYAGDNPSRPGLQETPGRVIAAYGEWFSGYSEDPQRILKTFEDGAELCGDELVLVRDIEFYSHCEHHMAPFFGRAHIAYIPDKRVVGLSKLARLTDAYARRLQVQERLTHQIANALDEYLQPKGVGVVVEATHFCMCSRGVSKQGSRTTTSALRGVLMRAGEARAELLALLSLRTRGVQD